LPRGYGVDLTIEALQIDKRTYTPSAQRTAVTAPRVSGEASDLNALRGRIQLGVNTPAPCGDGSPTTMTIDLPSG